MYGVKKLQVLAVPSALHLVLSFCTLLSHAHNGNLASFLCVAFFPECLGSWDRAMKGGSTRSINIYHPLNIGT